MAYRVEYYCVSHIGKCRKINQDNFVCNGSILDCQNNGTKKILEGEVGVNNGPVFGIFDGMGGEECGEMAAYLASRKMLEFKCKNKAIKELIVFCKEANQEICRYTKEQGLNSMGTTAAVLLFSKKKIYLCNIGDSKVFRLSGDELKQISYDHVFTSIQGRKPPLTQNLGIPEDEMIISPYIASEKYRDGDIYLICSDGLSDMVPPAEYIPILKNLHGKDAVAELLKRAMDNGGKDNITFIILYIKQTKKYFMIGKGKNNAVR